MIHPEAAAFLSRNPPLRYSCPKIEEDLELDGAISHPAWDLAPWTEWFVDIEGARRPTPRFRTRAKMLWSDHYFYVAAEMEEPHLWATLTEHDSVIFHDHDFEVFIDPDGDSLNYFEYEINALGTDWDLFLDKPYRESGNADNGWESYARKAVQLRGSLNDPRDVDEGWSVEIAFPWNCFSKKGGAACPPEPGDVWRVNFSRVEWPLEIAGGTYRKPEGAKEDNWVWSPQGVVDMHQPELWGFVEFRDYFLKCNPWVTPSDLSNRSLMMSKNSESPNCM